jgi:hypothetical protein
MSVTHWMHPNNILTSLGWNPPLGLGRRHWTTRPSCVTTYGSRGAGGGEEVCEVVSNVLPGELAS